MIHYHQNRPLDPVDVAAVFDAAGLKRPTRDLARIERMVRHANLVISAWDEDRLIGVCRALTDFSYCCYLSDLAVMREYQKRGIGQELLRRLREAIGEEVSLILLASPEAMRFYPKMGFDTVENGFIVRRLR